MSWGSLRPALGMGVGEHCPENLGKGCCPESRGPAPPRGSEPPPGPRWSTGLETTCSAWPGGL